MNKEQILKKSREENRHGDELEKAKKKRHLITDILLHPYFYHY